MLTWTGFLLIFSNFLNIIDVNFKLVKFLLVVWPLFVPLYFLSPDMPENEATFAITSGGITDAKEWNRDMGGALLDKNNVQLFMPVLTANT